MLSDALPQGGGADASALLRNFVVMSVCFSVNHGTVSSVIALSTSLLGTGLGSVNLGTLYFFYVLTALVFATAIIQALGAKGGLLFGTGGYCVYVLSFLLAAAVAPEDPVFPDPLDESGAFCTVITGTNATATEACTFTNQDGKPVCACIACPSSYHAFVTVDGSLCATDTVKLISLVGAAMGGVAAGFLWSAQGSYFARNAELFAEAGGTIPFSGSSEPATKERATAFFSSVFAGLYLGIEIVMRLLSSLTSIVPTALLLPTYCIAAAASAGGMLLIMKLEPAVPPPVTPMLQKATAAAQLLASHRPMQLLAPTEMVFGFAAAMMNAYVNGAIVSADGGIGKDNIGFLGVITVLTATLASSAAGWYTSQEQRGIFRGKTPAMLGGDAAFLALGLIVLLAPVSAFMKDPGTGDSASAWAMLVPLYMLQGAGRGIFESTNKAVIADFCPPPRTAAGFASFVILSGE